MINRSQDWVFSLFFDGFLRKAAGPTFFLPHDKCISNRSNESHLLLSGRGPYNGLGPYIVVPLLVRDGMGNLHQTPFVIFCYIAPVQWTLSEVLVNQATAKANGEGNLLKHQHGRLLWNMKISFQIEAIKWVLLLFDLPSAKVREHIHVLHVEGYILSHLIWTHEGGTQWEPQKMVVCMYTTTDFVPFSEIITGFWPRLRKNPRFCATFQRVFK